MLGSDAAWGPVVVSGRGLEVSSSSSSWSDGLSSELSLSLDSSMEDPVELESDMDSASRLSSMPSVAPLTWVWETPAAAPGLEGSCALGTTPSSAPAEEFALETAVTKLMKMRSQLSIRSVLP